MSSPVHNFLFAELPEEFTGSVERRHDARWHLQVQALKDARAREVEVYIILENNEDHPESESGRGAHDFHSG